MVQQFCKYPRIGTLEKALKLIYPPNINITDFLNSKKEQGTKAILKNTLSELLPKNFVANFFDSDILEKKSL